MTNSLTGDYDVIVEIGFNALNRILAALHEANKEPHSFVWKIRAPRVHVPTVPPGPITETLSTSDVSGETVGTSPIGPVLEPVPVVGVSPGEAITSIAPRGVAEVQVSTPTLTILAPQDAWTKIVIHQWIMIYFIPDPNSSPMPEFIHGELETTVNVALNPLPGGTAISVDLSSRNVQVSFKPSWTSTPLDQGQMAWLNQFIRGYLRANIDPINITMPQDFQQLNAVEVKFLKTATAASGALLLSISPSAPPNPNPASVHAALLDAGHDFAVAAGREYLAYLIQKSGELSVPDFKIGFTVDYWLSSFTVHYNIHVNSISIDLGSGKITLTIRGHAHTGSHFPDTDFTINQDVGVRIYAGALFLSALGDPSISLSGALGAIQGLFNGSLVGAIKPRIQDQLRQQQTSFQEKLNTHTQSIIQAINNALKIWPRLRYSDVTIEHDGIVLFGEVEFQDQVPVDVEFTQKNIPGTQTIELNALSSWIPGGGIGKFVWTLKRSPNDPNPKIITEEHRFVTRVSQGGPSTHPIDIARPLSICLRVEGNRVTGEAVSGVQCAGNLGLLAAPLVGTPEGLREPLPIAVAGNAGAQPVIMAYVNPWSSDPVPAMLASGTIIRFVDPKSPEKDLSTFHGALSTEKVAALVVVVLPQEHRNRIGSIELPANYFLGWTANHDEAWRRIFKVSKVPATVILNRQGKLAWQDTGPIAVPELKTAIKQNLGTGGTLSPRPAHVTLGTGNRAPDFRFEYPKGNEMTLSNLYGRPVVLVFWASWSEPSVEELQYLQKTKEEFGVETVVLAVNDVDKREKAEETFKKHNLTLPLIMDAHHEIARLYGISCWPTIVSIDAKGRIHNIHRGLTEKPPQISKSKAADIRK